MVFQNKLSDKELNIPPTCFPKLKFTYFVFKLSGIKYYLKDLHPHDALDSHNIFRFFNKMDVIVALKLAKIFRRLIAGGSFPVLGITTNITPILKDRSPFQFPLDYRHISITPIIFKVYEKLISRRIYKLLYK